VLDLGNLKTNIIVPLPLTIEKYQKTKNVISDDEIGNNMNQNQNNSSTITDELTLQIANMLRNGLGIQQTQYNLDNLSIGFKLNGDNYSLWATLMKKAIGSRGKKSHLTGIIEPTYEKWEQADQTIFTWIIQNIKISLINNVSQFSTSKALWEGLTTTYESGTNPMQIYGLHRKTNTQKQGKDTLENFWNKLQAIWMAIDKKQPNPMKCSDDIATFNKIKQGQRLYQFLIGIDEKFEVIRRDLLMQEKTPSVESTYVVVRRETARLQILKLTTSSEENTSLEEVRIGLTARNRPPEQKQG